MHSSWKPEGGTWGCQKINVLSHFCDQNFQTFTPIPLPSGVNPLQMLFSEILKKNYFLPPKNVFFSSFKPETSLQDFMGQ
jgi:hypothetical protein